MDKRQVIGSVGAAVLFLGVFMPIVSLPIVGGMNYFQNGRGDGVVVLLLAIASIVLAVTKRYAFLWLTGSGALGMLIFTLALFQFRLSQVQSEIQRSMEGNPFAALGQLAIQSVQIQWGWAVLLLGALLVLTAGAWPIEEVEREACKKKIVWVFAFLVSVVAVAFAISKSGSGGSIRSDVASRTGVVPKVAQKDGDKPVKEWQVSDTTNEMDGTKKIFLSRQADHEIPGIIGSVRPTLFIRCSKGETEVVVNVGTQIQNEYGNYGTASVRVKFDDEAPLRERWTESTGGQALFAPDAVELAKRMATAHTFLFEYTPFQRSEQTIRFTLDGLKDSLPRVAEACNWKP